MLPRSHPKPTVSERPSIQCTLAAAGHWIVAIQRRIAEPAPYGLTSAHVARMFLGNL